MGTYLVESATEQLSYRGRVSSGIPAEGYNFYLHLLDLEADEVSNLVVIVNRNGRAIHGRRAPTLDSEWWFVFGSPKAFWPGRSNVRARLRAGEAVALDSELVRQLREELARRPRGDGGVKARGTESSRTSPRVKQPATSRAASVQEVIPSPRVTQPCPSIDASSELHAPRVSSRLQASSRHRVFPFRLSLGQFAAEWRVLREVPLDEGMPWPRDMARIARGWPEHAFGVANASLLILWHRPGDDGSGRAGLYYGPKEPVLGGVNHLHVPLWAERYPDPSWTNLTVYVARAFAKAGIADPWRHVMVACLIAQPSVPGMRLEEANREAITPGGRIDTIMAMTRPLVVLGCGLPVRQYLPRWRKVTQVPHVEPMYVDHPSIWKRKRNGELGMGEEVVTRLARALRAVR